MYAASRRYHFDPKFGPEIDQKVKQFFVPMIQKIPGFVSYYWLDSGIGQGASISVFKDKKGADESVRLASEFMHQHLSGHHLAKPEVIEGPVKAHA